MNDASIPLPPHISSIRPNRGINEPEFGNGSRASLHGFGPTESPSLRNAGDPHWYHNCLGIIEFLTKLWGGSHCVIIPTDGKTIDEEFWTILSSHDPDIFYRYQPTGADEKARAPEEFERRVSSTAKKWAANNGPDEEVES